MLLCFRLTPLVFQPACLPCAASRKEEKGVLWPTLRCRREAGVSPLLSIGWWYLSSVSPKRHCCRVSAADKGCRVYPLDPRPDAVALYSGCTPGKRRGWFLPDDRHTASLVGLRGGWRNARTKLYLWIQCPGGEPKSVKRLRSRDLLIETTSALQTKSFLLTKSFLNNPVTVSLHKTLNSCRGVISEPDLLGTPDSEILESFSDQGVTQDQVTRTAPEVKVWGGGLPHQVRTLSRQLVVVVEWLWPRVSLWLECINRITNLSPNAF
ncbi:uncharacterized protein TNCV_223581 [Trichonephila clavipes]|nr:uncharacterized protein TNCV_223581 [Trichonephila clavipes]